MYNAISMSADFEKQKKIRSLTYTGVISGAMVLLFILIKWPIPVKEELPVEEAIEINLGNSENGYGAIQPIVTGEPASSQQVAYTPPQTSPAHEESSRDVEDDASN